MTIKKIHHHRYAITLALYLYEYIKSIYIFLVFPAHTAQTHKHTPSRLFESKSTGNWFQIKIWTLNTYRSYCAMSSTLLHLPFQFGSIQFSHLVCHSAYWIQKMCTLIRFFSFILVIAFCLTNRWTLLFFLFLFHSFQSQFRPIWVIYYMYFG